MILKCFVNDSEMLFNNFEKLSNDFEMFFNDLSNSSKNFGSQKNYKGGAAAAEGRRRRPCSFFSDPTIVQTAA